MKTKDIAKLYSFDPGNLDVFVSKFKEKYCVRDTLTSYVVDDTFVNDLVEDYKQYYATKAIRETEELAQKEQIRLADAEKQAALARMLVTSGFSFDGYTITKYSGYISGDDAIEVSRGYESFFSKATNVADALMDSLVKIRRKALSELKEAAYALGCNAVIGVDFDYLTLDPQTANSSGGTTYLPYIFGVTANGNAVIIEKHSTNEE